MLVAQKILEIGRFNDFESLSTALGIDEASFRSQLDGSHGIDLPVIIKLKLLSFSGVTQLEDAIELIDSEKEVPKNNSLFDLSTGSIRWIDALDALKTSAGFVEDKQLADYLKISTSTLSDFKRGKSEISGRIKLKILDFLGFHTITSGLEFFLRDELAAVAKRARQRQAKKIAQKNSIPVNDY